MDILANMAKCSAKERRSCYCSLGCEGSLKLMKILRSGFVNVFETALGLSGRFNIERESVLKDMPRDLVL